MISHLQEIQKTFRRRAVLGASLLVIFFFTACTTRPEGVLSPKEMEDILYDIHRTEGLLQVQGYNLKYKNKNTALYYEQTLRKHNITQAQFDSSLVWYTDHPKRFDKIYPKVITRLEEQKEILRAYNEQLDKAKNQTSNKDTLPTFTPYTLEEWKDIIQNGLPLAWGIDSIEIDTAFVYPYSIEVQDSIQNIFINDSTQVNINTTQKEKTLEKISIPTSTNKSFPQSKLIRNIPNAPSIKRIEYKPNIQ